MRTGSKEGSKLLTILLGREEPAENLQNKQGIGLLTVGEGERYKGGLMILSGKDQPDGLSDPWGNPYVVLLSQHDRGNLHFNHGSKAVDLPDRRVAVFSTGKDGVEGNADDVRTWGN